MYFAWTTHVATLYGNSASHRLDKQSLQDVPATISDKNKWDTSCCVARHTILLFNVTTKTAFFQESLKFSVINIDTGEGVLRCFGVTIFLVRIIVYMCTPSLQGCGTCKFESPVSLIFTPMTVLLLCV